MWKWLQKGKSIKNDLLNFKDEPLTPISMFLLIVLNIFIFTNIQIGIDAEMKKVPKSYLYYPSFCNKHFENIQTTYEGFQDYNNNERNSHRSSYKSIYCQELNKKTDALRLESSFINNSRIIDTITYKQRQNNERLNIITKQYNTRLFEHMANMSNNKALIGAKNEYNALLLDNNNLQKELKSVPSVTSVKGYVEYAQYINNNKAMFEKEKASYTFWQPIKAYIHMLIFIIPLLLFFGFFYYKTNRQHLKGKKYNPIVKIISANITFLLFLPFLWHTLILIYYYLPKTLLKNIIDFLISIGLVSVLNYVAILLVVLLLGGLIYYIQKRTVKIKQVVPSNKKYQELISLSKCFHCRSVIDYKHNYCPFCGIKLHENCQTCNSKTIIYEEYCSDCGNKKQENRTNQ